MSDAHLNDRATFGLEVVDSNARAVMLVHGWSFGPSIWDAVRDLLPREVPVFAPALPGHGDEDGSGGSESDWLKPFACPEVQGAVWVGWSLGGMLALEAVRRGIGRPGAMLLLAVNPCFIARDNWPGVATSELLAMKAQLPNRMTRMLRRFDALLVSGEPSPDLYASQLRAWRRGNRIESVALAQGLDWLQRLDVREVIAQAEFPVALVLGDRDPLVPPEIAERPEIAGSMLSRIILPGEGHLLPLSVPERLADLICELRNNGGV